MTSTNRPFLPNESTPDENGHFGIYGGRYVPETLMPLVLEVERAYRKIKDNTDFRTEFDYHLKHYVGRPSPLYHARRSSTDLGFDLYFKRDELNHTGAHKINNCLGQVLLARHMGKTRIIAETGAGQHGVATATICALFDMPCVIFMGETDIKRQRPNVFRMKLLGAEIRPVRSGRGTLKDAMNEALRDWVSHIDDTFYVIGTAAGPHPYPEMVRDFQSVIGRETRDQCLEMTGRLPDALVACIGGGSNAIGLFHPFLAESDIRMYGIEAAGKGLNTNQHAASLNGGKAGVLHGNRTYLLQTETGQIRDAHSISAGLDYPGIGPEHAWLHDQNRVHYGSATDDDALKAFQFCARMEGILPALEPAHALGWILNNRDRFNKDEVVVMNLCGRGDKDIFTIAEALDMNIEDNL